MKKKKTFEIILAVIAWLAIFLQFAIAQTSLINLLSYFTILSNLFVAISLSIPNLLPSSSVGKFLANLKVRSGIALYIIIVAIVYNMVLRELWSPKGWQLVADNLLHVAIPALYFLHWLIFTPKKSLQWNVFYAWTVFPLLYLAYSLIRGHFIQWYPYPFLNAIKLGYPIVLLILSFMILGFFILAVALIAINRLLGRKSNEPVSSLFK